MGWSYGSGSSAYAAFLPVTATELYRCPKLCATDVQEWLSLGYQVVAHEEERAQLELAPPEGWCRVKMQHILALHPVKYVSVGLLLSEWSLNEMDHKIKARAAEAS